MLFGARILEVHAETVSSEVIEIPNVKRQFRSFRPLKALGISMAENMAKNDHSYSSVTT